MVYNNEKTGAFIVPTGIGASIEVTPEMQVNMPEDLQNIQKLLLTQTLLTQHAFPE